MEEKIYPPKVRAMYEAVLELFASGRELSTLKVSEITSKAGIGKGTAYEYFSTKEEIIVGAIEYEATRHFQIIIQLLEEGQTLPEIISRGLNMLEEANEKYHGLAVLEKIISDSSISGSNLLKEMEKYKEECGPGVRMTQRLMKLVKDTDGIRETNPWKVWGAILSQYFLYALYLVHSERVEGISRDEARAFVYQNILKILDGTT